MVNRIVSLLILHQPVPPFFLESNDQPRLSFLRQINRLLKHVPLDIAYES